MLLNVVVGVIMIGMMDANAEKTHGVCVCDFGLKKELSFCVPVTLCMCMGVMSIHLHSFN